MWASEKGISPGWYEPVATACMAFGNPEKAAHYYKKLQDLDGSLPQQTWLTAALYGLPDGFELPQNPPEHIKMEAMRSAAAGDQI